MDREAWLQCSCLENSMDMEGMMLKLKLQYFGHLMRRVDSLEKTLMLGGIGGRSTEPRVCLISPPLHQGPRTTVHSGDS